MNSPYRQFKLQLLFLIGNLINEFRMIYFEKFLMIKAVISLFCKLFDLKVNFEIHFSFDTTEFVNLEL